MKVQFHETIVTKDDPSYGGLVAAQMAAVLALVMKYQEAANPGTGDQVGCEERRASSNPSAGIQESGRGD